MILDSAMAAQVALKIAKYKLNDFVRERFDVGINPFLDSILKILRTEDQDCYRVLAKLAKPTYILRWMITWFAHDVSDLSTAARIFDYLIVSHSSAIVYMVAAIIISTKNSIMEISHENSDDISGPVFMFFQSYEFKNIDIEAVIRKAEEIQGRVLYPKILRNLPREY